MQHFRFIKLHFILILLTISFYPLKSSAKKFDKSSFEKSLFEWRLIIEEGNKIKSYTKKDSEQISKGIQINSNKAYCSFEFHSEWEQNNVIIKDLGKIYSEQIWLQCKIGDTIIKPYAVRCETGHKIKQNNTTSRSWGINIGNTNIIILCEYKKT